MATPSPAPGNFTPGSPPGFWSSGRPGRTSRPRSQTLSCERRRGRCASFQTGVRPFMVPADRPGPARGGGRVKAAADTPLTAHPMVLFHSSLESALSGAVPAWAPLDAAAACGSLAPCNAAASGPAREAWLCSAGLGRRPRATSPPASALAAFAFRGFRVETQAFSHQT